MKSPVRLNPVSPLLFMTLVYLTFSALVPKDFAVVPPPDGGYPNFTTAEGTNALKNLTSGAGNTGLGWYSLFSNTGGSYNTGVGAGTLALNSGDENTATGVAALLLNTSGFQNTATGALALLNNTMGGGNTANGFQALLHNTTGASNTANGLNALGSNTSGDANTANGVLALGSNTVGGNNTAIGALALLNNTTGSNNTAIGPGAGSANTTGTDNIYIGSGVPGVAGETFAIRIGYFTGGPGDSSCYIAAIDNQYCMNGASVLVNSDNKLGTLISSKRFKRDIQPMEEASEALFSLTPVTFRYKKELDPAGTSQFGLVAEDVEKVNPDLVVRDKQGKPYSVRYEQVNAMLLNEFLKEHMAFVQEQRKVQELETRVEKLTADLEKVTAQIELKNAAAQLTANQK
jgi:hypothetical protein